MEAARAIMGDIVNESDSSASWRGLTRFSIIYDGLYRCSFRLYFTKESSFSRSNGNMNIISGLLREVTRFGGNGNGALAINVALDDFPTSRWL